MTEELWEVNASWWQEGFTKGADPEYEEQILPLLERLLEGFPRVLDIGCGEGQTTRAASVGSQLTVGLDASWAQVSVAGERALSEKYVRGSASDLPFRASSFDAVLACLVFEHVTDMSVAVAEVSRILVPGGRFVLMLNHPLLQTPGSGWVEDHMSDPTDQYWRVGDYLTVQETVEEVELGVNIPFVHRPLSSYVNELSENELSLTRMLEPAPPPGFLTQSPAYSSAAHIPRLLVLVCEKR